MKLKCLILKLLRYIFIRKSNLIQIGLYIALLNKLFEDQHVSSLIKVTFLRAAH